MSITDEYGDVWTIAAKVKEPLEIVEGNSDFRGWYYRWRVILESVGTAAYESRDAIRVPLSGYGSEGLYGGVRLGSRL